MLIDAFEPRAMLACVHALQACRARVVDPDGNLTEYVLRVAGSPTLGSAGILGSDEKTS